MKIEAKTDDGKVVSADFAKFAQENAEEGEEFAGFGAGITRARFRNGKGETREVDMRELAIAGGLREPRIKFDKDSETVKQWYNKPNVDQGVAYNLERLKSPDARAKYLQEKGFETFFNDGDDYYSIKDGYITPINNNPDRIDLSDFTRFAANAGRDIGAAAGGILSGVAATATGGAALAMAGVTGAAGAAIGETIQRTGERLIGTEASKYNAQMGVMEEAGTLAKTAGIGALQGAGGQAITGYGSAAFGAAKKGVGVLAEEMTIAATAAKDFMSGVASRAESAVASAMPKSWMAKTAASSEEAVAQSLLKTTTSKTAASDTAKKATQEATGIARASAKPSAEKMSEIETNNTLRQVAAEREKQSIARQMEAESQKAADDIASKDILVKKKLNHIENAKEVYKNSKVNVEEIFKEGGDPAKATAEILKAESGMINRLKAIGVEPEVSNGVIQGIAPNALTNYRSKKLTEVADESFAAARKNAEMAFNFTKYPLDYDRAKIAGELTDCVVRAEKAEGMDAGTKEMIVNAVQYAKKAIGNHSPTGTSEDVGFAVRRFLEEANGISKNHTVSDSAHAAIEDAADALFSYANKFADNPNTVGRARDLFVSARDINTTLRREMFGTKEDLSFVLEKFDTANKILGRGQEEVSRMAFVHQMASELAGEGNPIAKKALNPFDSDAMNAFAAIRNFELLGIKKGSGEQSVMTQIGKAWEESQTFGPAIKTAKILKGAAKTSAKSFSDATKKKMEIPTDLAKRTAATYGMRSAEESFVNSLQKRYSSSDNRD